MPVADTELLFAFSPRDPKHAAVLSLLKRLRGLLAPDSAILEFGLVLRNRGRSLDQIRSAYLLLRQALEKYGVGEAFTMDTRLQILQAELERRYRLSFFDSLIAASTLRLDSEVVADDPSFDRIPDLKRRPISK